MESLTLVLPALFKRKALSQEGDDCYPFVVETWEFAAQMLLALQRPVTLEYLDINLYYAADDIRIDSMLLTEQYQGRRNRNLKKISRDEIRRGLLEHVQSLRSLVQLDAVVARMARDGLVRKVRVSGLDRPGKHFHKMVTRGQTSSRELLLVHFPELSSAGVLEILVP